MRHTIHRACVATLILLSCQERGPGTESPGEQTQLTSPHAAEDDGPRAAGASDGGALLEEGGELPVAEPSISKRSLFEQLRSEGRLALFSDERGVYAIDGQGGMEYLLTEPFYWLTLDYGSGVLWLNRSWPKEGEGQPGLFVLNLAEPEPKLVNITRFEGGFEVLDAHGDVLPMTRGKRPYQIALNTNPVSVTSVSSTMPCGEECSLSQMASELGSIVQHQHGRWADPAPSVHRIAEPVGENLRPGATVSLSPETLGLELRAVSVAGHSPSLFVWQLYDVEGGEFVSPTSDIRSKRKLREGYQLQHLMICESGGVVIDRGFFNEELRRLDGGGNKTFGVCLNGGVLFEDRSGLHPDRLGDPDRK